MMGLQDRDYMTERAMRRMGNQKTVVRKRSSTDWSKVVLLCSLALNFYLIVQLIK